MDNLPGSRNVVIGLVLAVLLGAGVFFLSPISLEALSTVSAGSGVTITAIVPNPITVVIPSIPPSQGGGGGGGGGFSTPSPSLANNGVVFKGLGYPGSSISLLKNGVLAAEQPASPDGTFEITLTGLDAGSYNFGLRANDSEGGRSALQAYSVSLTSGVTTQVSGIFFPPTIGISKKKVERGEPVTLFGTAAPQATVTTIIHSSNEIAKNVSAGLDGRWVYKLDTLSLENGFHTAKARAVFAGDFTPFSESLAFQVGDATSTDNPVRDLASVDANKDGKINLLDFSIMAYWFGRANPPKNVDLNHDGKVNLTDLSILAYYWTG